jgi:surface antigen
MENSKIKFMIIQEVLELAKSQLGKTENPKGSNWGEPVKSYLASVGITFPASWCMAFVYWCFNEVCKKHGIANPLVKTGGVLAHWNKTKALKVTKPQIMDIFIMDFGGGLGHTGFVLSVNNDGTIITIEGNSNDEGSREGFEVCSRILNISSMKGFIRYTL